MTDPILPQGEKDFCVERCGNAVAFRGGEKKVTARIWLSTPGTDGLQSQEICRALVRRYAAAFVDHDSGSVRNDAH